MDKVLFDLLRLVNENERPAPVIWAAIPSGIISGRLASLEETDRRLLEASRESPGDFDQRTREAIEKLVSFEDIKDRPLYYIDLIDVYVVLGSSLGFEWPYARLNPEQISAWGLGRPFRPTDE